MMPEGAPAPRSARTVAFQGERGAYSEEAAIGHFGEDVSLAPCRTLRGVFNAVEDGPATHGLVPIENSLAGSINESYDLLLEHSLAITGETVLRVRHCLLALPGQTLGTLRRVASHPQALAQCSRFIEANGLEPVAAYDTAGSAKTLAETHPAQTAAIAGRRAARLYGLTILAQDIESDPGNYTRFYVVTKPPAAGPAWSALAGGRARAMASAGSAPGSAPGSAAGSAAGFAPDPAPGSVEAKTVLVFATPHRPGSLYWCLGAFAYRAIDLLKLESRPIRGKPWEYLFYADIRGHASDSHVAEALRELETKATMIRVLGSFEAAKTTPV